MAKKKNAGSHDRRRLSCPVPKGGRGDKVSGKKATGKQK